MDPQQIEFIKEKIRVDLRASNTHPYISNVDVFMNPDELYDGMLCSVDMWFYNRKREVKQVTYTPPRQKFWDWIRGKKPKPFTVSVSCRDVLQNPPSTHLPVIRVYEAEIVNNNHLNTN